MTNSNKDWLAWHAAYADEASPLRQRLGVVQQQIRAALPERPHAFTILSLCAGQGDDVIGVLRDYRYVQTVRARLVELDPRNVACLRAKADEASLHHLEIVTADAADTTLYEDLVPVDLVLLCGIFGNISTADIRRTINAMPQLCRTGGRVIWTRSRRPPDVTPQVRQMFCDAGFAEEVFIAPDGVLFSVGACVFTKPPQMLQRSRLFDFID